MDSPLLLGALAVGAALVGVFAGWWLERSRLKRHRADAESVAARIREEAGAEAERLKREAELEGREEAYRAREEWEREEARRREDLERAEQRIEERRSALDRKYDLLDAKERQLAERESALDARTAELQARDEATARLEQEARARLEALAGMSSEEAGKRLMQRPEEEARARAAKMHRKIKQKWMRDGKREIRTLGARSSHGMAADHTADSTVSVVRLPSDEMKGRIIGREGRNIRAFEQATGIDVIIDDPP